MDYLQKENTEAFRSYLEHIINDLGEKGSDYHDKLAEVYFSDSLIALKKSKGVFWGFTVD